jgi:DNA-binding NtrC family response regulator
VALAGPAERISAEMLSEDVRGASVHFEAAGGGFQPSEHDLNRAVDELKRHLIARAIQETGSKSKAAERLGIPRQSLQKMMKRLGMP